MSRPATSRLKVNPPLGHRPSLEFRRLAELHEALTMASLHEPAARATTGASRLPQLEEPAAVSAPPSLPRGLRRKMPVPPDFAGHASDTQKALAKRYGVSTSKISSWRREAGVPKPRGSAPSKPPAGFREKASKLSVRELCRVFASNSKTVRKWRIACALPPRGRYMQPAPEDFAELARGMTAAELTRHYDEGAKIIARWIRETGAKPAAARPLAPRKRHPAPDRHRITPIAGHFALPAVKNSVPPPRSGREEEAAQFLRRHYPCVYRCDAGGHPDQKGTHWRCGALVLTGGELLAKAETRGWDADEWRRVA